MIKRLSVLLVGLSCLLGLVTPAQAAAPQLSAYFSRPGVDGTLDDSLLTRLLDLIELAAPDSTLRVATFVLEIEAVKDALVAARGRRVDVRVVSEGSGHHPLLDELAAAGVPVTLCDKGCNGPDTDISHHKFFVFSRLTDGRTDVVAQSSQNLSPENGLHQNMLISSGDAGLAEGYRQAFDTLASQVRTSWRAPFTSTSGKVTVWMEPRDTAYDQNAYGSTDLVAAMIRDVGCPGTIRVVQSQFATDRPLVIAELKAKKQQGCDVQVLVAEGNQTVATAQELAKGGIVVHTFRPGGCHYPAGGTCAPDGVHSKIILVDGPSAAAGGARRSYVYTGSHNLNNGSLTASDDSFVRIDDATTYALYDADFASMLDEVVKIVPRAYPGAGLQMTANGPDDQRAPRAAAMRSGYTALTWEDDRDRASVDGTEVYARIYHDGQPVTGPVKVSMGGVGCATGWNHVQPSAGVDDAGNAYVAWAEDGDCRGEHNIAVRRLSPAGTLSPAIWANDPQWSGDQTRPRIAVRGDGGFTVVWEDAPSGTVRAAGYTSPTARAFAPLQVGPGNRPDVAVDGAGTVTVVWQQAPDVYGRRISATGATVAPATRINTNAATQHLAPAVATTPVGDSVVAWSDNVAVTGGDVTTVWRVRTRGLTPSLAQRFAETPVAFGKYAPNTVSDGGKEYPPLCGKVSSVDRCAVQGTPSVAVDDTGRFVVGWTESDVWNAGRSHEVYARGFNADGTTTGRFPCERMNPNTTGDQSATAVAADGRGFHLFYVEDFDVNGYGDVVARTGFTNTGF
ncbi:phosphatidylserine/phosphatidylglycerophosphate/cardiolipin synthase family protein [Nonomuraea sp. NPDC052265]|uniref:phosphatidylserine/phosphatidylglycerophosphate/ cardiolipin synthase family protein n=1 Tax=Nonomuraea sp. NPDC052265 TaxID=3364374 RepID=UPI0037C7143B